MISKISCKILNFKTFQLFSSLAIINGTIVNADRIFKGDIYLENDVIKKIVKKGTLGLLSKDTRIIDANNKYVMPGGIDPHTVNLIFLIFNYSFHLYYFFKKII